MKFNSPLPQSLPKECTKAAKIFQSFVDSGNNGLDGVIPREVLENAKGLAIFTIFKAGFLFSARAGTGLVIAKLDDGTWSAPSAIGTAGLGVGGQAGAEVTDFLIVLNSRSAVKSFMAAGSLTLGGNMSIAVGPLGRNGEALGSLNSRGKVAAMYSYSKTRGLFGGVSIEGSVIMERQDANCLAYENDHVTAQLLLGGKIDPPPWASPLIKTLEACTGLPGTRKWVDDSHATGDGYAFTGLSSPGAEHPSTPMFLKKKKKAEKSPFPPDTWGKSKDSGSYFDSEYDDPEPQSSSRGTWEDPFTTTSQFETPFTSDFVASPTPRTHSRATLSMSQPPKINTRVSTADRHSRSMSSAPFYDNSFSSNINTFDGAGASSPSRIGRGFESPSYAVPTLKPALAKPLLPHEGVGRAIALYDFNGVESGDLSFSKGDVIVITKKSDSTDDWWTGKVDDRRGIFPANFVEVV